MTFNLIHALIFHQDEITKDDILITDFYDLADGDYIDHILIDKKNQKIICQGDNTHEPIEAQINSFVEGLCYSGVKVELEGGVFLTTEYHNLKNAEFFKKLI
jgi:hypothetical protein